MNDHRRDARKQVGEQNPAYSQLKPLLVKIEHEQNLGREGQLSSTKTEPVLFPMVRALKIHRRLETLVSTISGNLLNLS